MEPHSRDHASGHVLQAALLLLLTVTAGARLANALDFRERNLSESASSAVLARIKSGCSLSFQYLLGCFGYSSRHQFTFWDMVKLTTACGLLPGLILLRRHSRQNKDKRTPSVHSGSDVSETSGIGKFIALWMYFISTSKYTSNSQSPTLHSLQLRPGE